MQSPLRILVTRPDPRGVELCAAIEALGDEAIHFPTIIFSPPPDPLAFEQALSRLGEQDWLLFVSPQAVRASVPAIRRVWPQLPETVKFAAIGAGTANALAQAGYNVSFIPQDEWSSDALLGSAEFRAVTSQRIAIIRGEGGRELLEKILVERGAQVVSAIAYKRTKPELDVSEVSALLFDKRIDMVVCTSFEGVANLKQLLARNWTELQHVSLIVVSERMKALASDAGFQTIWVASDASNQAILAEIAQKRNDND